MSKRKRIAVQLPVVLFLSAASACGGDANQTAENRNEQMEDYAARYGVDVDVEGEGEDQRIVVNQPGAAGQAGRNLELPEDFPEDVPTYPGWSIHSSASTGPGLTIGAMVPADVEAVASFYEERLPAEGWTAQDVSETPAMRILRFSKDARVLAVMIAESQDQSSLQLTIATIPGS